MNADEFARLLRAKRIGRGRWIACCPSHETHGNHRPSLSIAEGRKAVVFRCMSQGCSANEILAAMGLTWKDILGERDVTPEMRGRWKDEKRLEDLEHDCSLFLILRFADKKKRRYWAAAERNTMVKIGELRDKLEPAKAKLRVQREKVHSTIAKFGFDKMWDKFLSTERGKDLDSQYGREKGADNVVSSTNYNQ
jgi:hypothetical protein